MIKTFFGVSIIATIAFIYSLGGQLGDVQYQTYKVIEGDTLYEIAAQTDIDADVRKIVDAIKQENDLEDSSIYAGQTLMVPMYTNK